VSDTPARIIFITGTDTGVGKTVVTSLLLQHLRFQKINALAMKPFCTGDRADVKILQKLQPGEISDCDMNPYFFEPPVAPLVAAKMRRQKLRFADVLSKISDVQKRCDVLLIEGAGGIMVPIGESFFIRDIIAALKAKTILVSRNKLGTLNHTFLSVSALQDSGCKEITTVLVDGAKRDFSCVSNFTILKQFLSSGVVYHLPFLGRNLASRRVILDLAKKNKKLLAALAR
jgi:dethiobiotin synthetase